MKESRSPGNLMFWSLRKSVKDNWLVFRRKERHQSRLGIHLFPLVPGRILSHKRKDYHKLPFLEREKLIELIQQNKDMVSMFWQILRGLEVTRRDDWNRTFLHRLTDDLGQCNTRFSKNSSILKAFWTRIFRARTTSCRFADPKKTRWRSNDRVRVSQRGVCSSRGGQGLSRGQRVGKRDAPRKNRWLLPKRRISELRSKKENIPRSRLEWAIPCYPTPVPTKTKVVRKILTYPFSPITHRKGDSIFFFPQGKSIGTWFVFGKRLL